MTTDGGDGAAVSRQTGLREIAVGLPTFSVTFPENQVTLALVEHFDRYADLDEAEKSRSLARVGDLLNDDPEILIHVLLSQRFEAFRENEAFAITVAYAYFLLGRVAESWWICQRMIAGGFRCPFLIDLAVRLLIEMDRFDAAQGLLAENVNLLDRYPPLIGRAAALLFIEGRIDAASELSQRAHSAYRSDTREKVNLRMDDILLMPKNERAALNEQITDAYSTPENQLAGWQQYQREMGEGKSRFRNDSCYFNDVFRCALEDVIGGHREVATAINYGALYGYIDWCMAKENPDRTFIGYDRAPVARGLNEEEFRAPNLHFRDGDFVKAVEPLVGPGGVLLGHCRTGTLIYPEDLERFYRTCREIGVTHIVAAEIVNYGEVDGKYPDFAHSNRRSTLLGGHMIQHDYAHYLGRVGYSVVGTSLRPTTCHRPYDVHGKVFFEVFQVLHARLKA